MKYLVANFKMNTNKALLKDYLQRIDYSEETQSQVSLILGVSDFYLALYQKEFEQKHIPIFAQNISEHEKGAFTGQNSIGQLKELNIPGVIIGHSEQRCFMDQQSVDQRVKLALKAGLKVILCVGEDMHVYNQNNSLAFVINQIKETVNFANYKNLMIAYEPIFAIGGSQSATSQHIDYMLKGIKGYFYNCTNFNIPVFYGGSVNSNNAQEILKNKVVDGLLIGSSCLDVQQTNTIINYLKDKNDDSEA
ncbi:triose-phosphate isomerase [Ureaplasma miroungigenitalium]|uniref:Triosephosphate isomerase n=1 Tax=Ureaplasma miroungigenitalium TaxID=1042321 RepID=A0ABT3BMF1_9BACT|nr:triose-phosphate isomerase family protein [Ureaplasma miroungigenitalium]MCV3728429.1 triose-phosphate isomerase [Ureaplasma miroungigenitalium]MCV3734216.1 triose-phosphate isomerase [Ureaplasma miroungigenitalium]